MNLEDVHVFAGIEGPDEARRAYPLLKEWAAANTARQALLHAGQIVRYARLISQISEFEAVAVYQAALTFWSYGVISNAAAIHARHNVTTYSIPSSEDIVCLDSEDSSSTQRYIAVNIGRPAITVLDASGSVEHAMLSNPAQVMAALIELLKTSHKNVQQRPFLVDNLLDLMGGLRAAVITDHTGAAT